MNNAPLPEPSAPPSAASSAPADAAASPGFAPAPGETPRAFSAFLTYFHLGHARALQTVADQLDEGLPTVKKWSSRFRWAERVNRFHAGLLQSSAAGAVDGQRRLAADWADRLQCFREQEWDAAQKLIAAARCFLESYGEDDLHKMTLAQVSRALKISSQVGRLALAGAELPAASDPGLSPVQQQFLNAVHRLYAQPAGPLSSPPSSGPAVVGN